MQARLVRESQSFGVPVVCLSGIVCWGVGAMWTSKITALLTVSASLALQMGCCSERLGRDVSARPLDERMQVYRKCAACARRLNHGANFTVLMEAARRNDEEAVDHLLSAGAADVNAVANGDTALLRAVQNGNPAMVRKLLLAGATPAYRKPFDLLRVACAQSLMAPDARQEILRLLLAHGADVNHRDESGSAPILVARDAQTARLLIEHGARVNDVDSRLGMNALHRAVYRRDTALASVLIDAGISVNARDVKGRTPLDCAIAVGDASMVSLLEERGGTRGAGESPRPASPQ